MREHRIKSYYIVMQSAILTLWTLPFVVYLWNHLTGSIWIAGIITAILWLLEVKASRTRIALTARDTYLSGFFDKAIRGMAFMEAIAGSKPKNTLIRTLIELMAGMGVAVMTTQQGHGLFLAVVVAICWLLSAGILSVWGLYLDYQNWQRGEW